MTLCMRLWHTLMWRSPSVTRLSVSQQAHSGRQEKIHFWQSVYGFDMSCIRDKAMLEPLVDTVDSEQIVTNACRVKALDISKVTRGDLSFTAPFKLTAERNDFVHALVAYFDVAFTKCHKAIGFSTSPRSRSTHWKQTVLYLEDTLTMCEGESVTGTISVKPNERNNRDLDISVTYQFEGKRCKASRTQHYRMR
eukprot:TRINITY_DN29966_c0_g1_i3.p1 TRINITY_DN29966_c0_g1~~TRINITY_DN29966_c0_g1_i3.p1  ORF type:complete len:194 (-),score=10.35 TRINITY_DN29966_c0_g1_i3:76-657(-)